MSLLFFKPTPLYKEYLILDLIENYKNITQRELSKIVGTSVSMINTYLDSYEKMGMLKRVYISEKKLEYVITKKGIERKKVLNIGYLKASHKIYLNAKENIKKFIYQVKEKGFNNILLYGAGEVAQLLLLVLSDEDFAPIKILGVIDDDLSKKGKLIYNFPIIDIKKINNIKHDGIIISSYTNRERMYDNLLKLGYSKDKIVMFIEN